MKVALVLLVANTVCCTKLHTDLSDVGLSAPEMIANHGYVGETHYVTTDDGYIVTLHRIPYGKDGGSSASRPVAFLMHGMTSCSADYVNMGPGRSLGFLMADAGYDVWMGNARGNGYSRNHTSLDIVKDAEEFFDFSWHEIGYYDVAASIDHILETTGESSLYYVGHSQGTTAFLVLASSRPEYNDKIRVASLMAPAAILEHRPMSLVTDLALHVDQVERLLKKYKIYEIPFLDVLRGWAVENCVKADSIDLCRSVFSIVGGDLSNGEIEDEMIPVIASNSPSNTAMKQLVHYGQSIKYGGFKLYNYGAEKNLELYGSEMPPDYDLSKISVPVALYYSQDDGVTPIEDVRTLISKLPNVANSYEVPFATFNHIDFVFAKDVVALLYEELIATIRKY